MTPAREETEELADLLRRRGEHAAVAESLTGGLLTNCLAAGPHASEWLRGGVVAYGSEIKRSLLGVQSALVVSQQCAIEMAEGAAYLLDADVSLAATGVGGPDPLEGQPPGTVWIGVCYAGRVETRRLKLSGSATEVCVETCRRAVRLAIEIVRGAAL